MAHRQYSDRDRHARPDGLSGMAGRRQAGSLPIFLGKFRRWAGRDFTTAVPETFAMVDGRRVDGHGMVAVDVAIAHRGPREVAYGRRLSVVAVDGRTARKPWRQCWGARGSAAQFSGFFAGPPHARTGTLLGHCATPLMINPLN